MLFNSFFLIIEIQDETSDESGKHLSSFKIFFLDDTPIEIIPYILTKHKDALKGFNSPGINVSYFEKEIIPIPPLNEQKRIVKKVNELMKDCNELEEQVKSNQKNSELLMESVLREAFESSS